MGCSRSWRAATPRRSRRSCRSRPRRATPAGPRRGGDSRPCWQCSWNNQDKQKENELKDGGNEKDLKSQQNLTNILGKEAKKLEFNEKEKAQMDILDQITGGLASKAANFADASASSFFS